MNMQFKKNAGGEIKAKSLGFNLTINIPLLLKENTSKGAQKIIDSMIESKWRWCIKEFEAWKNHEMKLGVDYKYKVHVDIIQEMADMVRFIIPLHSDIENIFLFKEEHDIINEAYSYWKYNSFYGFESISE